MATILDLHQHAHQTDSPFPGVRATTGEHFRLACLAAVSVVWEQVAASCQDAEVALAEFPFLRQYRDELAAAANRETSLALWWVEAVRDWELMADSAWLPIRALRDGANLDGEELALLFAVGLAEEDPSFGALWEVAQARPGLRRPTAGLLHAWWRNVFPGRDSRLATRHLLQLGLIHPVDRAAQGSDVAYQVPYAIWDALRGCPEGTPFPGATFLEQSQLPRLVDLVLPQAMATEIAQLRSMLADGTVETIVIRGPRRNGRETLLQAIARDLERSALVLEIDSCGTDLDRHAPGPLATMLGAIPIVRYDLVAGEVGRMPHLPGYQGPIGVVLGPHGGLEGARLNRAVTMELGMPDLETRRRHWQQLCGDRLRVDPDEAARHLRLTSGTLRRVAGMAPIHARLDGRTEVTRHDLRQASSALNRQALDSLATWLPPLGDTRQLVVGEETAAELAYLRRRCRHRDDLHASLGPAFAVQGSHGVRALFAGPSGTGKSFAVRHLATDLGLDLYRIDLAAVVDKYIGETEKHLGKLFSLAEELDVILLLDEGDALLGERSAVNSATDRYANLETNYLLQRLETFEGVIIVTTNASDRIDRAFERRMDVVVNFHLPDAHERTAIWRAHLPPRRDVAEHILEAAAGAYRLSGGQIRNAALHAGLLALDDDGLVRVRHLEASIQREYRKLGQIAPELDADEHPFGTGDG